MPYLCLHDKLRYVNLEAVLGESLGEEPKLLCADLLIHIIDNARAESGDVELVDLHEPQPSAFKVIREIGSSITHLSLAHFIICGLEEVRGHVWTNEEGDSLVCNGHREDFSIFVIPVV